LWLNLVTNGLQDVALATEPAEGGELERPPRQPTERIFDRIMIERVLVSGTAMASFAFVASQVLLRLGWTEASMRNAVLLLMVFFENLQVGNSRSELKSVFALSPRKNRFLVGSTVAAQAIHIGAMWFPPLQPVLRVEPVSFSTYAALFGVSLTVVAASELHKRLLRARATARETTSAGRSGWLPAPFRRRSAGVAGSRHYSR
jgi:magnesium-transporting ATPase (P-type)